MSSQCDGSDEQTLSDEYQIIDKQLIDSNSIKIEETIPIHQDTQIVQSNHHHHHHRNSGVNNSNNISSSNNSSSRSKVKDLSSNSDWYLRRKSYGFEKMTPTQPESSSAKMLESTDSGIGR